jgi:superfamily II DNA or RNA helicase
MQKKMRAKLEGRNVQEYGLDGLSTDGNGNYYGLQYKYYIARALTANDLGSFFAVYLRMQNNNKDNGGYVYYADKLEGNLADDTHLHDKLHFVKLPYEQERKKKVSTDPSTFDLLPHQQEPYEVLMQGWNGFGLLSMPCSTGKTVVLGFYLRKKQFNTVVMFSPTRVLTKQNFERIRTFLPDYKHMLIDSDADGTRDVQHIRDTLEKENKVFLCSTYASMDVLQEVLSTDDDDAFCIVDECHNMNDELKEYVSEFKQSLMMSATPRVMMDIQLVYELKFSDAVSQNLICDYEVYIPCVTDKSGLELEVKDLHKEFIAEAEFLATGMLRCGARRVIVYHRTKADCATFNDNLKRIFNEYHNEKITTSIIVDDVSQKEREKIIEEFDDDKLIGNHYHVISAVRVLDEGIDLPLCDSVYFANPSEALSEISKIRSVQRFNRATRKHKAFPNKMAKVFIYCDDYHAMGDLFQLMKTNDANFKGKVRSISANYDKACTFNTREAEGICREGVEEYIMSIKKWRDPFDIRLEDWKLQFNKKGGKPYANSKELHEKRAGQWQSDMRKAYKGKGRCTLTDERIATLNAVEGWTWEEDTFLVQLDNWKFQFNKKGGKPSEKSKDPDEKRAGKWQSTMRSAYKGNKLNDERIAALNAVEGWTWEEDDRFFSQLEKWQMQFRKKGGKPSTKSKDPDEKRAGQWQSTMRKAYKGNKLTDDRIATLNATEGWSWSQ